MSRVRLSFGVLTLVLAAVVVVVLATGGGSSPKAQPAAAPSSAISLKQTGLGPTLVDANGRTLYLFEGDRPNVSTLSAAGQAVWPPFVSATKPRALTGTVGGQIGTIAGASGTAQITYNGHPLYYYVGDHGAGQTHGQGLNEFGALWYALGRNGTAITSAAQTATPTAPSSSGSVASY